MLSKILSILLTTVLTILFSACGADNLSNDPNKIYPTASISLDESSISIAVGTSKSFEVNATKVDLSLDSFTAVSSDTNIFDVNTTETTLTINAKSIGLANLTVTSDSGVILEIPVSVTDKPTLTLSTTTLSLDVSTQKDINVTATSDGTIEDNITASSSDTNILVVSVLNNVITVTGISPGNANVLVVSASDINATCSVTVNIDEDPNEYANNSSATALATEIDTFVNDIVASKDDWYVFDTVIGKSYEVNLKKYIDNGGAEAKFYTDPTSTEDFSILVDDITAQTMVSHIFTATSTKIYAKISNYNNDNPALDVDSLDYLLSINLLADAAVPIVNPTTLTVGQDYIKGIVNDSNGVTYSFAGEYGKLYEVWIYDAAAQPVKNEYTLDVLTTAYTQDKNQTYYAASNMYYTKAELINPVKSENIHIHVKPRYSGQTGTYAIKVVEKISYSEGMKTVKFPIEDALLYSSKVGKETSVSQWSYYSTDAIASVTKTVSLSNISPAEGLYIKIFEDSECKDEVASVSSGTATKAEITHKYSKSGLFCVGVFNSNYKNNAVYDMKITGNKPKEITTYPSLVVMALPDDALNGDNILFSEIEVKYGVSQIKKVTVDLNITHVTDKDLIISLISPKGTEVILSANQGGLGVNYTRTKFDDNATEYITNGVAPFSGSFQPETPLSAFIGESPNGIWMLRIEDIENGDSGTLDSWSITIE